MTCGILLGNGLYTVVSCGEIADHHDYWRIYDYISQSDNNYSCCSHVCICI